MIRGEIVTMTTYTETGYERIMGLPIKLQPWYRVLRHDILSSAMKSGGGSRQAAAGEVMDIPRSGQLYAALYFEFQFVNTGIRRRNGDERLVSTVKECLDYVQRRINARDTAPFSRLEIKKCYIAPGQLQMQYKRAEALRTGGGLYHL